MSQKQSSIASSLSFNSKKSCLCCALQNGFRILNVEGFTKRFKRVFIGKGVRIMSLLGNSNIIAVVKLGFSKKVSLWDDYQSKMIVEMDFDSSVTAVRLFLDKIVVVSMNKITILSFRDLHRIAEIPTANNSTGLLATREGNRDNLELLIFPGKISGHIAILEYQKKTVKYEWVAFDQPIGVGSLNFTGNLFAIANQDGTSIRVFHVRSGICLCKFKRGKQKATIFDLTFSPDSKLLVVTSSRGSIHVFKLPPDLNDRTVKKTNKKGIKFGKFGTKMIRSVMKCPLQNTTKSISEFIKNKFHIFTLDGWHYTFSISQELNTITQDGEPTRFLKEK
ncbi:wd-repeat protein interacting with phosphoinosides wipi -related [Anaeramoeba flamelloides]|uniref:Wd-repeat protein interacting with phosphoinosides wipi -related n=1 Tax=Anaeramoeba flamelloides TaxID=1746091 RepID=A0AAV7ZNI4_9EUKA|nr:wd-repeat protein interacting with phosphoinosides wipi -related [Anaeramoeba flamelloides]|eukprot:Anaeramoba_flamelloidesa571521_16.p1 GENE.a571521_16~~a571521_16.p1  ORF type:complete len:335 (-),score=47.63 a571521_16:82-1086(-)